MSKTIISCYKCGKKMRVPADKHIRLNCVQCREVIEVKNGVIFTPIRIVNDGKSKSKTSSWFRENLARANQEIADKKLRNKIRIIAGVAVFVVALLIYLFMTEERRAFNRVADNPTVSSLGLFLKKYPEGEYRKNAIYLKDSLWYFGANETRRLNKEIKGISNCKEIGLARKRLVANFINEANAAYEQCLWDNVSETGDFITIETYRETFPEGKYADSIDIARTKVWENLYRKYEQRVKDKQVSTGSQNFFKALLDYAERTGEININISFNSEVKLKDWSDYTDKERDLVDMMTTFSNSSAEKKYPLPSESKPPSIKNNFFDTNLQARQKIISAFQSRLDSVFLPGTFNVTNRSDQASLAKGPQIKVDYKIETLSEKYEGGEFPSLYVWTEGLNPNNVTFDEKGNPVFKQSGKFLGYLLATGIDWDVKFTIPKSKESISLQTYSRPNESFSNVGSGLGFNSKLDNASVYKRMLSSAFQNYAKEVSDEIGL